MKEKKWIQHISGQGQKWELVSDWHWHNGFHFLPKSEYVDCEPPEEWEDVTGEFYATENWPSERWSKSNGIARNDNNMFWVPCEEHNRAGDRLRKVQLLRCDGDHLALGSYKTVSAFIIERKK
jgi:hypothetical protein